MSLRTRILLAFVAVTLVMGAMALLALYSSHNIQNKVTDLTSISLARLEHHRSVGSALEVEVEPGDNSTWLAREVQVLGGRRRPKLRGSVEEVSLPNKTLQMYGVPIRIDESSEFSDLEVPSLADVRRGDRLEISCEITPEGGWRARKIRARNLKNSDKIKGVVTEVAADGTVPDTLAISGITIILDQAIRSPGAEAELFRISTATQIMILVNDCDQAALRLVTSNKEPLVAFDGELADPFALFPESLEDLAGALETFRETTSVARGGSRGLDEALWLVPFLKKLQELEALGAEFLVLVQSDLPAAKDLFESQLNPLLMDEMKPLIQAYVLEAEESLAVEVGQLSIQAGIMAKSLLSAGMVAFVCALALGYWVWRSISTPLLQLSVAAEKIGQGQLDTRVLQTSTDELGILARTINKMAAELESNTVSIANLDDIFESMAGALFVLDKAGQVLSVNQAACSLTRYSSKQIQGKSLADFCTTGAGVILLPDGAPICQGEASLHRVDGQEVPVSFSGASLRRGQAAAGGFVWVAQDLSGRLDMEEQLRQSLAEKVLLLREVHHRVKNNLQIISSLLALQADCIESPEAKAVFADSQARIRSMALIHQQLYGTTTLDSIDFGAYLEQLAGSLFSFHGGQDTPVTIKTAVENLPLGIDTALTCGLIINELVTNAIKHAFDPNEPGIVKVVFTTEKGFFVLTVEDNGTGFKEAENPSTSDSLGLSLVEALVDQLHGTMTVSSPQGTLFRIEFAEVEA